MEKYKPHFLTFFLVTSLLIVFFAIFKTLTDFHLAWLGVAVASGVYPFFIGIVLKGISRRSLFEHLRKTRLITLVASVFTVVVSWPLSENPNLPLVLIGVGIVLIVIYMRWYSILEKKEPLIRVGDQLPMFSLEYPDRNVFTSMTLFDAPSIIIFYRGNWCPFCVSQVTELASNHQKFRDRGIQLVFVSPQPRDKIRRLAERFLATNIFLYDKEAKLACEWNINSNQTLPLGFTFFGYKKETVLPTVIMTDKKRRITYIDQTDNYRLRPLVDELLTEYKSKVLRA